MSKEIYPALHNEQLTSLDSAKSANPPGDKNVRLCRMQAEGGNVRYTDDGTTVPTATVGMILYAGFPAEDYIGTISNLQFFEVTAGAKVNIFYYG